MDDKITYIITIFVIIFTFLEKYKKDNRNSYAINSMICCAISGIFFAMAVPNYRANFIPSNTSGKGCLSRQRTLYGAIQDYQYDKKVTLPENLNKDELIKFQKECLIKEKYLKELINKISRQECVFEIKDGDLYCREHGSHDATSPLYTQGFPTYDDGKAKKEFNELVEKATKKREEKRKTEETAFMFGIIALLPVIKYSIFFFKTFRK
ncbi:MAG: hypothetical protein II961_01750 [Candidatus Riflebacteria bacterium]|nr:hypothetical protein [Candidatus Riflebacteria bacterium]